MTDYYLLGIHLGIDLHILSHIEKSSDSTDKAIIKVINYWFDHLNPSWPGLADAVKSTGKYNINLAKKLADK